MMLRRHASTEDAKERKAVVECRVLCAGRRLKAGATAGSRHLPEWPLLRLRNARHRSSA
jgi:hypothetical protein